MNSLFKIRVVVIIIFVLLYSLVFIVTTEDKKERVQYILEQKLKDLNVNYQISNNYFKTVSDNAFYHLRNNPEILELLYLAKHTSDRKELENIRTKLYFKLEPFYKQLNKSGVIITLFSFENNRTLLRLHKPSKFGDNLSKVRYSFTYVNQYKKPIRGFEQGKISHAFRNIFPIFYRGEYLGSVDIAFSSESLQEGMNTMHKIDTHFILNKNLFGTNIWKAQKKIKYIQSVEHDDFLFALAKTEDEDEHLGHAKQLLTNDLKKSIRTNISQNKAFSLYREIDNTVKVITFSPINDIKNEKVVAYLVSYTDSPYLKSILGDYILINSSVIIGMIIIIMLIYNIVRHRFFLQREVTEKTKKLEELNENLQHDIQKQLSEIRQKDGLLLEQAKQVSIGEMIGNIAHQWRQPLNALGLILQKIPILHKRNKLDMTTLDNTVEKGMVLINKMSATIDDFRYFFQEHKESNTFRLIDTVENCHALLSTILEHEKITFQVNIDDDIVINGHANELSQVLLNIINNAKDALTEMSVPDALISVSANLENDKVVIEIVDNAGGIPENIISKIFEPYFTTKEEGKGTGIGLFMSKRIIEESMQGRLTINNTERGARFSIIIPQSCPI